MPITLSTFIIVAITISITLSSCTKRHEFKNPTVLTQVTNDDDAQRLLNDIYIANDGDPIKIASNLLQLGFVCIQRREVPKGIRKVPYRCSYTICNNRFTGEALGIGVSFASSHTFSTHRKVLPTAAEGRPAGQRMKLGEKPNWGAGLAGAYIIGYLGMCSIISKSGQKEYLRNLIRPDHGDMEYLG